MDFLLQTRFNKNMQDYYRLLEVHPEASQEVIGKAYRTLVLRCHPDAYHVSDKSLLEDKMKNLNRAYEVLSNPKLRADYDEAFSRHQTAVTQNAGKKIWNARLSRFAYYFALTAFVLFAGKSALRLFMMLPFLLKIILLVGLIILFRKLILSLKGRRLW